MVDRVAVEPRLLTWAQERSKLDRAALTRRFPKLEEWERRERQPTVKQLDAFARATHTPVDVLLRSDPPAESVPIPDRRAVPTPPSADLLDSIAQAQQRQGWYREFARADGDGPVRFVGSSTVDASPAEAAAIIRSTLAFEVGGRGSNWTLAIRRLADAAEELGVLVMMSGVVGSSTRRKLDPEEFRGFTLADPLAPVVFVNSRDPKASQLFTLAHGLAHIAAGETALWNVALDDEPPSDRVERWCSEVALELLVPLDELGDGAVDKLVRRFKASPLIVLRRLRDAGQLSADEHEAAHRDELTRLAEQAAARPSGGGNFYATQPIRVSKRFARAVVASTLEGRTPDRDAFRMLGFSKRSTLDELGRRLGVS